MKSQSFESLPEHILVSVFRKMPNIPLVRMRQTCSRIDAVVEAHRQKIAHRPTMGMDFQLNCCAMDEELVPDLHFRGELVVLKEDNWENENQGKIHFGREFEADFDKKLSAIAISTLKMCFTGEPEPAVEEQLVSALRRIRLVCDSASVFGIRPTNLLEIVKLIDCKGKMAVQMKHEEFNDETFRVLTAALKENPKHPNWKPTVNNLQGCTIDGLFEQLKPFRAARLMNATASTLNSFVLDIIANSESIGHLQKISCVIWSDHLDIEEFLPWEMPEAAPFTVLWDIFLVPMELCKFELEIPGKAYTMEWIVPRYIRLVELKNHFLINIEFLKGALLNDNFFFLPKDGIEVAKLLIHHLRLDRIAREVEDAYLRAPQELRTLLLAKVFIEMAPRNLLRQG